MANVTSLAVDEFTDSTDRAVFDGGSIVGLVPLEGHITAKISLQNPFINVN